MIKTADAKQMDSLKAVNNIVIKPNQIIQDRVEHYTLEDILLEYSLLCQQELSLAKNPLDFKRIDTLCDVTFENLNELETPEKIAIYEAKLKERKGILDVSQNKKLKVSFEYNESCNSNSAEACSAMGITTKMIDYTLRVIFYPLKVLMTGDLKL